MSWKRLATAALLAALASASGAPALAQQSGRSPPAAVYVTYNFYHTDVIVSRAALLARPGPLSRAVAGATDAPWILIGWGDDAFGRHSKVLLFRMLKGLEALLLPNGRSAMRILGLEDPSVPVEDYSTVREIPVTDAELSNIERRLDRSLAQAADGDPVATQIVAMSGEHFFESRETYSLLHQCNHWIGEVLRAGGAHTRPVLDPLPLFLLLDLRLQGHAGRVIAHRPMAALRLAAPAARVVTPAPTVELAAAP